MAFQQIFDRRRLLVISGAALLGIGAGTPARAADVRYLKGVVLAPADRPAKPRPVPDVTIHARGSKDVPTTDDDGRFWLILPAEAKPGDALTVDAEKEGFRLWQPLDGLLRVPNDPEKIVVEIQLAPIGSKRFLSPPAIEALVTGMMARARDQIGRDAHPATLRLDRYLRDWATRYGLAFKDVKTAVDGWAAKVKSNKQSTPGQKSEAAFVRHELADAARLSHAAVAAAAAEEASFDKEEASLAARRRAHEGGMRDLLKKEADANFLAGQLEPALALYRRVQGLVDRKRDPAAWAAASLDVARAERQLGSGDASAAEGHLQRGAEACRDALEIYTREQFPKERAAAESDLGAILEAQARLGSGKAADDLYAKAVEAFEHALEVEKREQQPEEWASGMRALARLDAARAARAHGARADELYLKAEEALRATLEVSTADRFPSEWAETQSLLGALQQEQAGRAVAGRGDDLLARAADAFRFALRVRTRDQSPQEWAATERALAGALAERGKRTPGPKGDELLAQSAEALASECDWALPGG